MTQPSSHSHIIYILHRWTLSNRPRCHRKQFPVIPNSVATTSERQCNDVNIFQIVTYIDNCVIPSAVREISSVLAYVITALLVMMLEVLYYSSDAVTGPHETPLIETVPARFDAYAHIQNAKPRSIHFASPRRSRTHTGLASP